MAGVAQAHHGWTTFAEQDSAVAGVLESADLGAPHGVREIKTERLTVGGKTYDLYPWRP